MSERTIVMLLLAMPTALAGADSDPWADVPALPTSCYKADDPFPDRASAAAEALSAREAQQREINQAIGQQQSGEMDIMEMQQRMVTLMMERPDQAQQYMEALQQGGQQVQEQAPEMAERAGQLDTELKELTASYDAELQRALGPIEAQQQVVAANLANSCNQGLVAKAAALRAEENRAYEGLCANWWKAGPFHDWFARFRQFKVEEAALWEEHTETTKLHYELMGIQADQFHSTEDLKAPVEYLRRANEVFFMRRWEPVSEEVGDCEVRHG